MNNDNVVKPPSTEQIGDPEDNMKKYVEDLKKYNKEQIRLNIEHQEQQQKNYLEHQEKCAREEEEAHKRASVEYIPTEIIINKAENGWVLHHVRNVQNELSLGQFHEVYYTAQELLDRLSLVLINQINIDKKQNE